MIKTENPRGLSAEKKLKSAVLFTKAQLKNETDSLANLANLSAVINMYMDDINWVGFYLMKEGELLLGPFQGKPACNRIKVGEGVCGTAVKEKRTQMVGDVLSLDNHIACDSDSRSELVIPIYLDHAVYGVLDIDSPSLNRFTDLEKTYMEEIVRLFEESLS